MKDEEWRNCLGLMVQYSFISSVSREPSYVKPEPWMMGIRNATMNNRNPYSAMQPAWHDLFLMMTRPKHEKRVVAKV